MYCDTHRQSIFDTMPIEQNNYSNVTPWVYDVYNHRCLSIFAVAWHEFPALEKVLNVKYRCVFLLLNINKIVILEENFILYSHEEYHIIRKCEYSLSIQAMSQFPAPHQEENMRIISFFSSLS